MNTQFNTKEIPMTEAEKDDLQIQIIEIADKLDDFVEEMEKRIATLRDSIRAIELEKPKAKEREI